MSLALARVAVRCASEAARPRAQERPRSRPLLLSLLCLGSAAIAVAAWSEPNELLRLTLLLLLPALVFCAADRRGAFAIAFAYYAAGARAIPEIIHGFFPQLSLLTGTLIWAAHAAVLALPWAVAFAPPSASMLRRTAGVVAALVVLSLPPVGLFHWGSPLMAAGLLFPGWGWAGLALTTAALAAASLARTPTRAVTAGLVALALTAVGTNLRYREPRPPEGWHAVSLESGKNPPLWSDDMAIKRQALADQALAEVAAGRRVIIFPEAITGSSRRAQDSVWAAVDAAAKARGATVLVGEETWNGQRKAFRNALIGFGTQTDAGSVVVSSRVPMPMGDWKFGLADGAQTDLFGDSVIELHGRRVAFSICYEDLLLWPHRALLRGEAQLLISSANQWPSAGTSAERAQDMSRLALARLAGVALLTAKNR